MLPGYRKKAPTVPEGLNGMVRTYAAVAKGDVLPGVTVKPPRRSLTYRDVLVNGSAVAAQSKQPSKSVGTTAKDAVVEHNHVAKRKPKPPEVDLTVLWARLADSMHAVYPTQGIELDLTSPYTSRPTSPLQHVFFETLDEHFQPTPPDSEYPTPVVSLPNTPRLRPAHAPASVKDLSAQVSARLAERIDTSPRRGPVDTMAFKPLRFTPPTTPTRMAQGEHHKMGHGPSMSFSLVFKHGESSTSIASAHLPEEQTLKLKA